MSAAGVSGLTTYSRPTRYEVINTSKDIIIVLEFAGGELFNHIVQHGRMVEPQARRFFQQLISGIDYSHRLKVVHRDLKPENVLLDDDLNVCKRTQSVFHY